MLSRKNHLSPSQSLMIQILLLWFMSTTRTGNAQKRKDHWHHGLGPAIQIMDLMLLCGQIKVTVID